jgi:hypothetical protein
MPATAGNHPGQQPGTTQARHVTGQGQLPCAHKGPNFVSVSPYSRMYSNRGAQPLAGTTADNAGYLPS